MVSAFYPVHNVLTGKRKRERKREREAPEKIVVDVFRIGSDRIGSDWIGN